jgi:cytoskeleton protein RodZ
VQLTLFYRLPPHTWSYLIGVLYSITASTARMPYDGESQKNQGCARHPILQETGLPSFGDKLKLEREKRKITLEEISASTKIGTRMLQALEGDKFGQLPGGIFNKGFVRAYARAVGLDEDQAVADYLQASGEASPASETAARDNERESNARDTEQRISRLESISDSSTRRPLPWGVFAVLLLLVALALSLWSRRQREQERLATRPAVKSMVQSSGEKSPQEATNSLGPDGSVLQPSASNVSSTPAQTSGIPPAEKKSLAADPNQPTASRAALPGEFSLVIHAREESWVSTTVDGKSTASELLEAGTERTVHATKEVTVKAGNSGAVDLLLNGKRLDMGGNFGEVKTVTIGPAGLVPTASTTPTNP